MNAVKLAEKISHMVKAGDYVLGHSIFSGRCNPQLIVNNILKRGLYVQDSSQGIRFTARRFEAEYEDCLSSLYDFAEKSAGIVVIIAIPWELLSRYKQENFTSYDKASILLESTGKVSKIYTDIYGNCTSVALLPSAFVWGYLDVNKNIFVENENYKFNFGDRDKNISKLKPLLDDRYEKILKDTNI